MPRITYALLKVASDDRPTIGQGAALVTTPLAMRELHKLVNTQLVNSATKHTQTIPTDEEIQDALHNIVRKGEPPRVVLGEPKVLAEDMVKNMPPFMRRSWENYKKRLIAKHPKNPFIGDIADVYLHNTLSNIFDARPPVYNPLYRTVHVNTKGPIKDIVAIAHELGHAANHNAIGKTLGNLQAGMTLVSRITPSLGVLIPTIQALRSRDYKDISYTPALINAGAHIPVLADETAASLRALKYLGEGKGILHGLPRGKALIPALGTYFLRAGVPLLTTAALRGVRKYQQEH